MSKDLTQKIADEFVKVLQNTFDKYELSLNPGRILTVLLDAGMEDYMRSILDYYHLLDDNDSYFVNLHN